MSREVPIHHRSVPTTRTRAKDFRHLSDRSSATPTNRRQGQQIADQESEFWRLAALSASVNTGHALYHNLQAQYRSTRPYASHVEHEQAMTRLAALCGVRAGV